MSNATSYAIYSPPSVVPATLWAWRSNANSCATYSPPEIAPYDLVKPTLGVSEPGVLVEQRTLEVFGQTPYWKFFKKLLSGLLGEYSAPNWDGEGAKPVSHSEIINCVIFLETKIKGRLPVPTDFQVDPDSWISLEWYNDQSNLLEISFGPADKAMYSALIGGTGHYGDINLFDKRISKPLSAIFEVLDDNNPNASHRG